MRLTKTGLLLSLAMSTTYALDFAPGISLTYFNYTESPLEIQVEQMSFTGQLELLQPIVNETLFVSGRLGGTLATIAQWPSETTSPRFLGADSRLQFRFPLGSSVRMGLHAGVYFWTMYVADDPYGIENLTSPLVELRVDFLSLLPRPLSLELKLAPVSLSFGSIDTRNREITLTARYDLFDQPRPSKSVDLVLELTQTKFRSLDTAARNIIGYFSASLGLQSFL